MTAYPFAAWVRAAAPAAVLALVMLGPAHAGQVEVRGGAAAPFSLEFRGADIKDVVRALGQAANMNIMVNEAVTGQVTVSLKNVDLWAALDAILKTQKLTYVRDHNIIRILSTAEARDIDMETRVFPLVHAKSKDLLPVVERMKSDNANARISEDVRMNALVVRDVSLNIDRMARLLQDLDVRMPQVLIEAKIVEVSSNYARDLGVQWGGQYTGSNSQGTTVMTGGTTGAALGAGNAALTGSGRFSQTGDTGLSGNAYVVNLPAAVGTGAGGALGLSFGKLGGKLSLDLQLSAMQTTGNGKILSNPKVMTVNNKEAKISSGTDIPVQIISATAVAGSNVMGVQTISASLALSAVPTITGNDKIAMTINVEKSEPDFSRQVNGIPTITKRNANAEVVVSNGETIVLGGILTKNQGESEAAVPLLSKIPLIGWLFKKKSSFDNQAELMIFITPTIVRE